MAVDPVERRTIKSKPSAASCRYRTDFYAGAEADAEESAAGEVDAEVDRGTSNVSLKVDLLVVRAAGDRPRLGRTQRYRNPNLWVTKSW